jgi:tetratricopeptide (TPR) repeat protein
MNDLRSFKQKLSKVSQLWKKQKYDAALAEVESLLKSWPGNAHLHVLWASLVQLQEDPRYDLNEAKEALQKAVQLDKGSPTAAIELGHFLDNVEDDPQGASEIYADGVAVARQLLIDGLIGQAKAFRQLNRRNEFLHCLRQVVHLAQFERGSQESKAGESDADLIVDSSTGYVLVPQLKGPYTEQIQDLLNEAVADRSA